MEAQHTAAGSAATAVTAATLVSTLAGSPWWLTVSLVVALTVLGSVYLWTQTQIQLERLKAAPRATEPPAVAALRAAGRGSIPDDEPLRLTNQGEP
jgi:hypothetical protein